MFEYEKVCKDGSSSTFHHGYYMKIPFNFNKARDLHIHLLHLILPLKYELVRDVSGKLKILYIDNPAISYLN